MGGKYGFASDRRRSRLCASAHELVTVSARQHNMVCREQKWLVQPLLFAAQAIVAWTLARWFINKNKNQSLMSLQGETALSCAHTRVVGLLYSSVHSLSS
jgi:hypothetical protein